MNPKKIYILLASFGLLAGNPVWATAEQIMVPLAARFTVGKGKANTDWYLWRDEKRIETASPASGRGDIWERIGQDAYNRRQVFHDDRRIVEYTPGEIRTRQAEPDWSALGSIISPRLLGKLRRGGSKSLFGQNAVYYSGQLAGQRLAMWWLEQAQLPAQLQLVGKTGSFHMQLREIRSNESSRWPRASAERIATYAVIDAADFGDKEYDPFVARLQQQDGVQHTH